MVDRLIDNLPAPELSTLQQQQPLDKSHPHFVDPSVDLAGLNELEEIADTAKSSAVRYLSSAPALPDIDTSCLMRSVCVQVAGAGEEAAPDISGKTSHTLITWRPSPCVDVLLSQVKGVNYVYFPHIDALFTGSEHAELADDWPDETIVLGQLTLDQENPEIDRFSPKLLVYDVVSYIGMEFSGVKPLQRYEILRNKLAHRLPPTSMVQWCGEPSCAPMILSGQMNLPHKVSNR